MFCSANDIILRRLAEDVEKCAVTGHADNQIFMLLRVGLRVQKSRLVHHIVLHMIAFQAIKECADNELQLLCVLLCGEHRRCDLLVQEHAACNLMGRQLGYALEHRCRAMLIHGMSG